jgi:hypothetical protein
VNLDPNNPFVRGRHDIRLVARRQRLLIWMVLATLATFFLSCLSPPLSQGRALVLALSGLALLLQLFVIVGTVMLMCALRTNIVMLLVVCILMLVPFISLVILLLENRHATLVLRKAGLSVGFMGVKDEVVVRLLAPNLCRKCGYNLTGNVSGICPECGTPIQVIPVTAAVN